MPVPYGFESITQNYYFVLLLPWLLTFAIVFGLLGHYKIPKNKSARSIISIVIAFFTMPFAGPLVKIIGRMGTGLVLFIMGIIFLLILFELTGTKHVESSKKGGVDIYQGEQKILEKYYKSFALVVIIIAFLIFVGSGGMSIIGITIPNLNYPVLFFLGIMVLVIFWMLASEE
ncbi:MAG: hypothetical protein J7L45_00460 [Candidatus Aenigmarchaeota archaeon]|nr:hypothetical protein [Candidatus Aenigmarchaeota archaeon]